MVEWGTGGWGLILPWGGVIYSEVIPPVSAAGDVQLDGFLLRAVTAAIGEADNEIGGLVMTRLTAPVEPGDTVFAVETTLDWPEAGLLALDGVTYHYAAKTIDSFTGITCSVSGSLAPGAILAHRSSAAVTDINQLRSALERLRRGFFVNTAEGEDLSVVGRNLGVPRLPILTGDDHYRGVVKALAYNPRGSIYGIELALDALVGPGNWRIYEDLIRHPNTVFIYFPGDLFSLAQYAGQAFLSSMAWAPTTGAGDTLLLPEEPITVGGVRLKDLGEVFDFRTEIPSAVLYPYYPGAPPAGAWTYAGSIAEGVGVFLVPDICTVLQVAGAPGSVFYEMYADQGARLVPESDAEVSWLMGAGVGALTPGALDQISLALFDGERRISAGMDSTLEFGLYDTPGGGFLGPTVDLTGIDVSEVAIKKRGRSVVELWVGGTLISRVPYADFTTVTTDHKIEFGIRGIAAIGIAVGVVQLGAWIHTDTDFWGAREAGTADLASANPSQLVLGGGSSYAFAPGDADKHLRITGSAVSNPQGGNNNGDFVIALVVNPATVELAGVDRAGAVVDTVTPTRVTLPDFEALLFPDDLGKQIVLSGSAVGNDGAYTIDKILQAGTLVDLGTYATVIPERSNVCEVIGAAFASEENLAYRIDPLFADETGVSWEQSAASALAGDTITLRQPLWDNDLICEIAYTMVLSAQVLQDYSVENAVTNLSPLRYRYYPFYLSDLFAGIRGYLDDLTVAGVIPEYGIEE